MAARIFTCHHVVPERVFRPSPLFSMLISGVHTDADAGYAGDLGGENIAARNVFSEMRHQYYVWRNLLGQYDYVGFEHYRRVFFLDFAPHRATRWYDAWRAEFHSDYALPYAEVPPARLNAYLDYRARFDAVGRAATETWMSHYDIVVQRPIVRFGLESQWKGCQPAEMWDVIIQSVRDALLAGGGRCDIPADIRTGYCNNMYIMRSEIFDQYMTFYMDCAERILARVAPYQRMLGHCGERIFSLWLYQRQLDDPLLRLHRHPFLQSTRAAVANLPGDFGATGQTEPLASTFSRKPEGARRPGARTGAGGGARGGA